MITTANKFILSASQIVREVYSDLKDLGHVDSFIHPNTHTADFDLSEGFKLRCQESKQGVFYNVFRAQ